jgi:hypothetical protein
MPIIGIRAAQWFTDAALGALFDNQAARLPVQRDPYLTRLSDRDRGYVEAGAPCSPRASRAPPDVTMRRLP